MYSTTNHPIIPNPPTSVRDVTDGNIDTYFATISSLDRNPVKYPNANSFSVDLPQDYINVTSITLQHSYFPDVCDQFNLAKNNVDLVFRFTDITITPTTNLEKIIYTFIKQNIDNNNYYRIRISDGTYTQQQLTLEVQNRMNHLIVELINQYSSDNINQTSYKWGDHTYTSSGTFSVDNHMVMIHSSFNTYAEALDSYLHTLGSTSVVLNLDNANEFAKKYGTALNPPPLLVIPTIENITDSYLGTGAFGSINGAAISATGSTNTDSYVLYVQQELSDGIGFNPFKLFYDKIQNKCVFGSFFAPFEVVLDFMNYYSAEALESGNIRTRPDNTCIGCDINKAIQTNYINWGLPVYMGFSGKEKMVSYSSTSKLPIYYSYDKTTDPSSYQPFTHNLSTGFTDSDIFIITPCNNINIEPELYYYMEIDGMNMIDELHPYKNNAYAVTNGRTTGVINSLFARRTVRSSVTDQYKEGKGEIKTFTQPLRRMNKISIKIRYSDGREPDFGAMPVDLILKIECLKNQIGRPSNSGFIAPA